MMLSRWLIVSGLLSLLIAVCPTSSAEINGIRELGTTSPQPQDMIEPDPSDAEEDAAAADIDPLDSFSAELEELSYDELMEQKQVVRASMQEAAKTVQERRAELRDARNEARLSDERVAEILAEINDLRRKIEEVIDEIPEIKEAQEEIAEMQGESMELMQKRRLILERLQEMERSGDDAQ